MTPIARTFLIVLLILVLLGSSVGGWNGLWGWGPSGGIVAILAVVVVLILIEKL